ncbi:MAG: N-acetyl-gamma-glutamyl-phosphate reductase [Acidobacteria bacterium]|nr:N-acetyl-gamma-glutamyl-phosphate reductase [Acidobacteriota bacterium]
MSDDTIDIALFGATGYSGREAARLLAGHPSFRLAAAFGGRDREGMPLASIHPALRGTVDLICAGIGSDDSIDAAIAALREQGVRFAMLATPEALSLRLVPRLLEAGFRVVDLSGAFRLRQAADYPGWYGFEHDSPDLLGEAQYGLSEWTNGNLKNARLVANPGCYPTAALLALIPLRQADLIDPASAVVVHATAGASGAGRHLREDLLFCEIEGSVRPYGLPRHRHLAEIAGRLDLSPGDGMVFLPHLAPIDRGLLCSISLRLRAGAGPSHLTRVFTDAYGESPFVRLLGEDAFPSTAEVRGTNSCALGWNCDPGSQQAVLFSALDNLVKGAAGQAVQNLNLMLGRPAAEGLPR